MTSGLYACNAIMFALYHRADNGGAGQVIDVSLFESLFSLLGPLPAEFAALGRERTREGSRSRNAGPRGCYRTRDERLDRGERFDAEDGRAFSAQLRTRCAADGSRFATNEARVQHALDLDAVVAEAIASRTLAENAAIIEANHLTAMPVQTVADIERDPHWRARNLTVSVPNGHEAVRMHNVFPRFSETPGAIEWAGGELGQDNAAVFGELGLDAADLARLGTAGVI